MEKFIENYKGYNIYKCKQDMYMKLKNINYLAYDKEDNLVDGNETLGGLKKYIKEVVIKDKETWICYYTNSNGDKRQKIFDDMEKGLAFTQLLDKRIEKETCRGYTFMKV